MEQADCLLLNGNGKPVSLFPLSIINWKTAVKLFLTREVFLIKEHHNKVVRSPSFEMRLPSILMLPYFHHHAEQVKFSRANVFIRDDLTCQYCHEVFERKELTIDHVIPKSKGGKTEWDNVVTSRKRCNIAKGSKDIKPNKIPTKPSIGKLIKYHKLHSQYFPDAEWGKYIQ
jgi:5-methylcytosine-specific restriction endonuclease McrA